MKAKAKQFDATPKDLGKCDRCGKTIRFGNAVVILSRNVEQIDVTEEYPGGEAHVMDSQGLLQFCAECGSAMDAEVLTDMLRAMLAEEPGEPADN